MLLSVPNDAAEAKLGRRGKYTESPAETHYNSGKAKLKAEDLDGAIDAFLQATYFARNGYYPDAYYWLGICYMDKQEDKKAIEALEKHVAHSIEEPTDAFLALAEIHLRNKRWDECEASVTKIKKYDAKTQQKVQYIYGLMEDRKADDVTLQSPPDRFKGRGKQDAYAAANEFFRKKSIEAMEGERRSHWMNAEGHFERALGDRPWTWTKVWLLYCEEKMKLGKWAEALRELNKLYDSKVLGNQVRMPQARLHKDIGVCKLAIGDHQGALDNWHRALDYNKNDYEVWLQLGMLLESERHFSAAAKDYREFLRLREGSNDERVQQVRDRLTKIEHMLNPNETMPTHAKPSQYMRDEMGGVERQQFQQRDQNRRQQQQQQQRSGDSGF